MRLTIAIALLISIEYTAEENSKEDALNPYNEEDIVDSIEGSDIFVNNRRLFDVDSMAKDFLDIAEKNLIEQYFVRLNNVGNNLLFQAEQLGFNPNAIMNFVASMVKQLQDILNKRPGGDVNDKPGTGAMTKEMVANLIRSILKKLNFNDGYIEYLIEQNGLGSGRFLGNRQSKNRLKNKYSKDRAF